MNELEAPNEEAMTYAAHGYRMPSEVAMADFMRQAQQDVPDYPTLSSAEVQQLRVRLIKEELEELEVAYAKGDLVEVADAVTDLYYVILGTATAHGLNQAALFEAVHANNMNKLATGHRDEGGKFIKHTDHRPPDLKAVLVAQWRTSPIEADGAAVNCTMCNAANRIHNLDAVPFHDTYRVLCDGVRVKLWPYEKKN